MHYVCTDLHGNGPIWDAIKQRLELNDTLYFLGDAIDRGPDGATIMIELLEDPRVTYIKGNHEQFVEQFLSWGIKVESLQAIPGHILGLWEANGGSITMQDLWIDTPLEKLKWIYARLRNLPEKLEITIGDTTFLLSHAGYTPRYLERDLCDDRNVLLWNREHFSDTWEDGDNIIVLHGHTPVGYLKREVIETEDNVWFERRAYITDAMTKEFEPVVYAGGHKVDLDLCSFVSNRAALYCLETKTWEIIDINE